MIAQIKVARRYVQQNLGWGDSRLQRPYAVLRDYNTSWDAAATLLHDYAQGVFKMTGLSDAIAADQSNLIVSRIAAMDMARSTLRSIVIDSEGEEFTRQSTPLAGLGDLLDKFATRLAAAADMPVTVLMGQSPAGLSATGASDIRLWYDRVASAQQTILVPAIRRVVEVLCRSTKGPTRGVMPAQWVVQFPPLYELDEQEEAQRRLTVAQADQIYIQNKVFTAEEIAQSRAGGPRYSAAYQLDLEARAKAASMAAPKDPEPAAEGSESVEPVATGSATDPHDDGADFAEGDEEPDGSDDPQETGAGRDGGSNVLDVAARAAKEQHRADYHYDPNERRLVNGEWGVDSGGDNGGGGDDDGKSADKGGSKASQPDADQGVSERQVRQSDLKRKQKLQKGEMILQIGKNPPVKFQESKAEQAKQAKLAKEANARIKARDAKEKAKIQAAKAADAKTQKAMDDMRQLAEVVNPVPPDRTNQENCSQIAEAVVDRLLNLDPQAVADPDAQFPRKNGHIESGDAWATDHGFKFDPAEKSVNPHIHDAYETVRELGPGTIAILDIKWFGPDEHGVNRWQSHVVVLTNRNGTVVAVEGQFTPQASTMDNPMYPYKGPVPEQGIPHQVNPPTNFYDPSGAATYRMAIVHSPARPHNPNEWKSTSPHAKAPEEKAPDTKTPTPK